MPYKIEKQALLSNELEALHMFLVEHQIYCPQISRKSLYKIAFCGGGGIGVGVEVHCQCCGKVKDITDYGSW